MNYSPLTDTPLASRLDEVNDWFSGETWTIPQPLGIECSGALDVARGDDPANDWIPL